MDVKSIDQEVRLNSRVLLLGPPAAGKSSLAENLTQFGLTHYNLDHEVFRLCKEKSHSGLLPDTIILEAVKRFIGSIQKPKPAVVELPYHDYLSILNELELSEYDCIALLTASWNTLCQRNQDRENSVPEIYIARSLGAVTSMTSWLSSGCMPWLCFDMDLFTIPQVTATILDFLRRKESLSLSRLSIGPLPEKPYIGGHLIDAVEWDDNLIDELQQRYSIRSVLDIGCGSGLSIELFQNHGVEAWGVEGNLAILDGPSKMKQRIMVVDLTKQWIEWPTKMDLVWCTEVLEHIPCACDSNLIRTISSSAAKVVFVTAAQPNQPGYNHVNCQPLEYWISRFEKHGLKYLEETNNILDKLSNEGSFGRNYLKENGMIFEVCL